MSLGAGQTISF